MTTEIVANWKEMKTVQPPPPSPGKSKNILGRKFIKNQSWQKLAQPNLPEISGFRTRKINLKPKY